MPHSGIAVSGASRVVRIAGASGPVVCRPRRYGNSVRAARLDAVSLKNVYWCHCSINYIQNSNSKVSINEVPVAFTYPLQGSR